MNRSIWKTYVAYLKKIQKYTPNSQGHKKYTQGNKPYKQRNKSFNSVARDIQQEQAIQSAMVVKWDKIDSQNMPPNERLSITNLFNIKYIQRNN